MYNQEIKEKYLKDVSARNLTINAWFKAKFEQVEKFEKKNGVDLCEFHINEIVEYYKSLCSTSLNSLLFANSQFSLYTQWCISNGFCTDSQNHYLEVTNEVISLCINRGLAEAKYVTREELLHILNEGNGVNNPSDHFLILALFEGLGGKDLTNFVDMRPQAIDDNNIMHLADGRNIKISDKLKALAIESAETYALYGENGKVIPNVYYAADDPEIIKVTANSKHDSTANTRRFYVRLLRAKERIGCPAIDRYALIESGRLEMIRNMMKEQGITDPATCISRNRAELERVYGRIQSISQYINRFFPKQ